MIITWGPIVYRETCFLGAKIWHHGRLDKGGEMHSHKYSIVCKDRINLSLGDRGIDVICPRQVESYHKVTNW
jgi:hypothetical protein